MSLRDRIKRHEGRSTVPYYDSEGILTGGYGRNLEAVPFSENEMELMFSNDLRRARTGAKSFEVYQYLSPARQDVITEMCFQMGVNGVSKFKRFLSAALQRKWSEAAKEMIDSRWATQTPSRAKELSIIFERG